MKMLRTADVAERLNCSTDMARSIMRKLGAVNVSVTSRPQWRIDERVFTDFLNSRKRMPEAKPQIQVFRIARR